MRNDDDLPLSALQSIRLIAQSNINPPSCSNNPLNTSSVTNSSSDSVVEQETLENVLPDPQQSYQQIQTFPSEFMTSHESFKYTTAHSDNYVDLIDIPPNCKIAISGFYNVCLIEGKATLSGKSLKKGRDYRVKAPDFRALPAIQTEQGARVLIKADSSGLEKLPLLAFNQDSYVSTDKPFCLYSSNSQTSPRVAEICPKSWTEAIKKTIKTVEAQSIQNILVTGHKRSGKSSFIKFLIHSLFDSTLDQNIYLVDIDPGQPIFNVPSMLSLLKLDSETLYSSVLDFQEPEALYCLNSISPKNSLELYAYYITLLQKKLKDLEGSPIVIYNLCGWLRHEGQNALQYILSNIDKGTYLIHLGPSSDLAQMKFLRNEKMDCVQSMGSYVSPVEWKPKRFNRDLLVSSYFHYYSQVKNWNLEPLLSHPVLKASYSPIQGKYNFLFASITTGINLPDIHLVFLGAIISVVLIPRQDFERLHLEDMIMTTENENLPVIPAESFILSKICHNSIDCRCLGLAVLRNIDTINRTVHLISPINETALNSSLDDNIALLLETHLDLPAEEMTHPDLDALNIEYPFLSKAKLEGYGRTVWRPRYNTKRGNQLT